MPKPLYNRRDGRYDVDHSKENKCQETLMTIPNRLGNVATKYADFVTDGKKISMNCKNMDRIKNSLLPFTQMNSTYQFEGIDHQHEVEPSDLLWDNKTTSLTNLIRGKSKKSGTIIYVDRNNELGLGTNYAFFKLEDYMSEVEISCAIQLSEFTNPSCLPVYSQIISGYYHDVKMLQRDEKKKQYNESKVEHQERVETCKKILIPLLEFFILDLKNTFVDRIDSNLMELQELERMPWIL